MNDLQLPLLKLFYRLRDRGMLLTIEQYDLLRASLASGFGLDWDSLERICQLLWVKPSLNYDLGVFQREFKLFKQQHQAAFQQYQTEHPPETPTLGELPTLPPRRFPEQERDATTASASPTQAPTTSEPILDEGITAFDAPNLGKPTRKNPRFEPEEVPISLDLVRQTWQKLRAPAIDLHQTELDYDATVERINREGVFSDVVMRPTVRKTADLLLLVDEGKGMTPYAPVWQPWIQAVEERRIPAVEIYSFSRGVSDALYNWQQPLQAEPLDTVLLRLHHQRTVVVVLSDVGAATSSEDETEITSMQQLFSRLSHAARSIVCLNPVPEQLWQDTSAERIARYLALISGCSGGVMLPFDVRVWSQISPRLERQGIAKFLPQSAPKNNLVAKDRDKFESNVSSPNQVSEEIASQQIARQLISSFRRRYGDVAFDFACHAAFPLTLTTDLAYCLRQEFCQDADWSVAPILLLSDLCAGVGGDLYEIPIQVRYLLLEELLIEYDDGEARLYRLADFMAGYIQYRICRSDDTAAKFHGDPPNWIALSMLKEEDEATKSIEADLAKLIQQSGDEKFLQRERLRLVSMMRGLQDLFTKRGLTSLTLHKLTERFKQGEPIDVRRGYIEILSGSSGEDIGLDMISIPGGSFIMGSPEDEPDRHSGRREGPQHQVTVEPFYLGRYPITQKQWEVVARYYKQIDRELSPTPVHFGGENHPVKNVSWADAKEFCNRLSVQTGKNYCLPTEAQWEYACRAGSVGAYHNSAASCDMKTSVQGTNEVGLLPANDWGLNDMHGNVWEWCEDDWHPDYDNAPNDGSAWVDDSRDARRVIRGGAWDQGSERSRSAYRAYDYTESKHDPNKYDQHLQSIGFRVCCVPLQKLTERLKPEDPIDIPNDLSRLFEHLSQMNFPPIKMADIEYATITFDDRPIGDEGKLKPFSFETVRVNLQGEIVERVQGEALAFKEMLTTNVGLVMVAIPSGKFMMGSPKMEHDRYKYERPQHKVTVKPFFMGKYPITQAQWRSIANTPKIDLELNPNPSVFKGDNLPVEKVSWEDASEFCKRLSREKGRTYRLPTEAEWEYACRSGTSTSFHFGETINSNIANYKKYSTTPVGSFKVANNYGLYDLHGNVWEWCQDHWHDNYQGSPHDGSAWIEPKSSENPRVMRGGSWRNPDKYCRSAFRNKIKANHQSRRIGFRVVCEIP